MAKVNKTIVKLEGTEWNHIISGSRVNIKGVLNEDFTITWDWLLEGGKRSTSSRLGRTKLSRSTCPTTSPQS